MFRILMLSADVLVKPMGGLGEHVRELSVQIAEKRQDACIDVVTPTYGEDYAFSDRISQRFALMMVRTKQNLRKSYPDIFRYQSELIARSIKLPRPNIVHAHDWTTFDAGRIIARHFGVPFVVTVHLSCDDLITTTSQDNIQGLYTHMEDMQYSGLLEANAICHVSRHYQMKFGHNLGVKSIVCGNGLDFSPWEKEYEPMELPGNRPKKLVYIGRIAFMKNVDTLMSIDLPEDVDLCIIGGQQGADTSVFDEVRKIADKRPEVHMMGALHGEEKIRAMKSATAGIFPSRHEPFGIVGLEWMMAGVPFGASYVDGMKDYLADEDIALHCGTSKFHIEEAVKKLCSMPEEQRKTRVAAGLKRVRDFGWDRVADRVLEAYEVAQDNAGLKTDGVVPPPGWLSDPAPLF